MIEYKIVHTTQFTYSQAVPSCHNLLHLVIRPTPHQQCLYHRLVIAPAPADRSKRVDYFGNPVEFFTIHEAHQGLTVTATSRVRLDPPPPPEAASSPCWEQVARQLRTDRTRAWLDAYQFAFVSPAIPVGQAPGDDDPAGGRVPQVSPEAAGSLRAALADYARESFPPDRPILEANRELTSRIHADFVYDPRATTLATGIDEVFANRRGVCQDFAHLQIACLRSLGLAARYVSGYLRTEPPPGQPRLVGADASHAWLSLFAGEARWLDYDPTTDLLPAADHVTLAWGRDYSDVRPIQGVFIGGGQHAMNVSVDVTREDRSG